MLKALAALIGAVAVLGLATVSPAAPADLSRVRILAIVPFAEDVYVTPWVADYGASRLAALASRRGFQVIPPATVAAELKRLGVGPRDLVSLTRTVEVGTALGADGVLTTHVTQFQQDREDSDINGRVFGLLHTRVDVNVRILEVATRLRLLQESVICRVPGIATAAMECVAQDVAQRLTR